MEYSVKPVTSRSISRKSGKGRSSPFRAVYVSNKIKPLHLQQKKKEDLFIRHITAEFIHLDQATKLVQEDLTCGV